MKLCKCDIYLFFWSIYRLQETWYDRGPVNQVAQLFMLLIGLWGLGEYVLSQRVKNTPLMNAVFALFAMSSVYGIWNIAFGNGIPELPEIEYMKRSLNSITPVFLFYSAISRGIFTSTRIKLYFWVMLAVCSAYFFGKKFYALETRGLLEITNNAGYTFVALIPVIYFFAKKQLLQYILLGVALMFALMSMKRGAILTGGILGIIFMYSNLRSSSMKTRLISIALSLIFLIAAVLYVEHTMDTSARFVRRIEATQAGDSSGRDYIYMTLLNVILREQNPIYLFFGHGADSTMLFAGNYAHNDWLEIGCNNGLLGVAVLVVFFFVFAKTVHRNRKTFPRPMAYSFFSVLVLIAVKSLFSMSVLSFDLSTSMLVGYFAYQDLRERRKIHFPQPPLFPQRLPAGTPPRANFSQRIK